MSADEFRDPEESRWRAETCAGVTRDFESFFQAATGRRPYGYQARIARDGLPGALTAPTGTGKTSVILAWLWRLEAGSRISPAALPGSGTTSSGRNPGGSGVRRA